MKTLLYTAWCNIKCCLFAFLRLFRSKSQPVKTLYIIGNGFDLHHGLNTSYQSFAFYLQDHHVDIYDLLTEYFGLPDIDRANQDDHRNPYWSMFEKSLADIDYEQVLDDNSNYLADPASDDFRDGDWHALQIEMEGISEMLTNELFAAFKSFIIAVHFPPLSAGIRLNIDASATFLNFNYTDTLEVYYAVPDENILYIHGKAKTADTVLVLGHGVEPDSFKKEEPKPPENATEDEIEWWRQEMAENYDLPYEMGRDEILGYYYGSFKQTKKIIEDNTAFFEGLAGTEKVIVLGHSLGEVDHPYLRKVLASINDCSVPWYVSYYDESQRKPHMENLKVLGLHWLQIHLRKMKDI